MAELATIQEDAILDHGFTATGAGRSGAVRLTEAKLSGNLSLHGATLRNAVGPAFVADGLTVQDVMMTGDPNVGSFEATGAGDDGAVQLMRATITGRLSLELALIVNSSSFGVPPAGAGGRGGHGRMDQVAAFAEAGHHDPGAGCKSTGAVCLMGAVIGGDLVLRRAVLISTSGPALMAGCLTVKGDAAVCEHPSEGFFATGSGELGAFCLAGATITGQLNLSGTTLVNLTGPALAAAFAQIQGDAFIWQGFTAIGSGKRGAVYLVDATFAKELVCAGVFSNVPSQEHEGIHGPALDLSRAKVGTLRLGTAFESRRVKGFYANGRLEFDGLTYTGLPQLGSPSRGLPAAGNRTRPEKQADRDKVQQWLSWFEGSVQYTAQPYQALAAAYENAGRDDIARCILIRQCDQARKRGSLTSVRRAGQFFSKPLIGYGYHCVWAIGWLATVFIITAVLAIAWFGPSKSIVSVPPAGQSASSSAGASSHSAPDYQMCSITGDISYAIEVGFPIINLSTSSEQQCDVSPTNPNQGVIVFGWILRVLTTTLAAVYVLGISGLNRSSPSATGS